MPRITTHSPGLPVGDGDGDGEGDGADGAGDGEVRRQGILEYDPIARDPGRAVVEHEGEEDVVGLGLDPLGPARLDEPPEHRQRGAAESR